MLIAVNQCQLFEPHEPLVILLSTTCTYALLYLSYWKNPGWVTDQDWIEDYRVSIRLGVHQLTSLLELPQESYLSSYYIYV